MVPTKKVESFDIVISSLAFHYIPSFEDVLCKVSKCLVNGGDFIFSVEHPIFTAQGPQDWYYDNSGNRLHWPVDQYFNEGVRKAVFLGEEIVKYHKTITTYINNLIKAGFEITGLVEPQPAEELLNTIPEMSDETQKTNDAAYIIKKTLHKLYGECRIGLFRFCYHI